MNGKACGLLKVITNDISMSFEGSVVGNPEYKNGEYWVYLPQGTYQLRIKASKKEPVILNFRDYNLNQVESKSTYELNFKQSQDASNIYLNNAYSALREGRINEARSYYQQFKDISGRPEKLFETELSKADGTYIWSEEELLQVGFKVSKNFDEHFNKEQKFVPIPNAEGETGLIQDDYKDAKIVYGHISDGFVNGLVLLHDNERFELAYICQGKIMAPSVWVLEKTMITVNRQDAHEDYSNTLFINEDVVMNTLDVVTGEDHGAGQWIPYLKQIYSPDIIKRNFIYSFSLGEVDMDTIRRNFNDFVRNGNRIPSHLWGRK